LRRNWIKLYVDQVLRGTCFEELIPDERFIWFGFLLLAGDNAMEGKICVTEEMGFSKEQLASLLKCDTELIKRSIKKMIRYEKIKINKNNVIQILNWQKYQSEYQRQRDYREEYKKRKDKRKKSVVTQSNNAKCGIERDIEEEEEIDKDKEKNILRKEKEKYLDFVFLTKEEHKKLLKKLGKNRTDDMIERLNNYIGSHGKKYKSHYFTILTWDRKDPDKKTIIKTKFFKAEDDKGKYVPMPDHFKKKVEKDLKIIKDKKKFFNG